MNVSISNIAWTSPHDLIMYTYLHDCGFSGIEIAPTRTFPGYPDCDDETVKRFSVMLHDRFNLMVCSIQSILFGRTEKLFGSETERLKLSACVKKAMDTASLLQCPNLVFGSPKNRVIGDKNQYPIAVRFFRELSCYAEQKGTVLSIEPNPMIYGTNFINDTNQAFELVKEVNHPYFRVNVDFGTMIQNGENLNAIEQNMELIHHVHISEPHLRPIAKRPIHRELAELLKQKKYPHYVSIEMKECGDMERLKAIVQYVGGVFELESC